jgi:hypothetical protein
MADPEFQDGPQERMDAMQLDEQGNDNAASSPTLELSEKEAQMLELYDQLEDISLEISLLQTQNTVPNGRSLSTLLIHLFRHFLSYHRSVRNCL